MGYNYIILKGYFYNVATRKFYEIDIPADSERRQIHPFVSINPDFKKTKEFENIPEFAKCIINAHLHNLVIDPGTQNVDELFIRNAKGCGEQIYYIYTDSKKAIGKSDFFHKVQDALENRRRYYLKTIDSLNDDIWAVAKVESEYFTAEHPEIESKEEDSPFER